MGLLVPRRIRGRGCDSRDYQFVMDGLASVRYSWYGMVIPPANPAIPGPRSCAPGGEDTTMESGQDTSWQHSYCHLFVRRVHCTCPERHLLNTVFASGISSPLGPVSSSGTLLHLMSHYQNHDSYLFHPGSMLTLITPYIYYGGLLLVLHAIRC